MWVHWQLLVCAWGRVYSVQGSLLYSYNELSCKSKIQVSKTFYRYILYILLFFRDAYPMLLVANKIDLVRQRRVTEEQGRALAASLWVTIV